MPGSCSFKGYPGTRTPMLYSGKEMWIHTAHVTVNWTEAELKSNG